MIRKSLTSAAIAAVLCIAPLGAASADFPEREITVIVNYGAGGATDLSTRTLARAMESHLGVPLNVVNRTGGSGTVGPTVLANSPNDGYTIGVTSFSPLAIQPNLREVPFTLDDFDVLAATGRFRYGLAVRADSEFQTLEDLIEKAKEGRVTVSAAGPPNNIALHQLNEAEGTNFEWIPYGGGNEAVVALLSGEVVATSQNPTDIVPHVRNGELRMLASLSPIRWFELPDVPTLEELGYDISIDSWAGLSAPAGVDPDRLAILEEAIAQAMNEPEVQEQFSNLGMDPAFMPGAEYREFLANGIEEMGRQLREIGMVE